MAAGEFVAGKAMKHFVEFRALIENYSDIVLELDEVTVQGAERGLGQRMCALGGARPCERGTARGKSANRPLKKG